MSTELFSAEVDLNLQDLSGNEIANIIELMKMVNAE